MLALRIWERPMTDPEIVALREKLTSRPRSDDYRQRRRDIDERGLALRIAAGRESRAGHRKRGSGRMVLDAGCYRRCCAPVPTWWRLRFWLAGQPSPSCRRS